jgi:putative flavoprotein involved in K+ transport
MGMGQERLDAVIIGGGQAGLATAYELRGRGVDCVALEAHARIGDQWRRRWDSLRLFTPARLDALPGSRFPAAEMTFPTKDEMADYLEAYAAEHSLPVRTGTRVLALRRLDDGYAVDTSDGSFATGHVVIATGYDSPRIPGIARQLPSNIKQLHAFDYRNPSQLSGDVLVVGAGTSGVEIAVDAASAGHRTVLAGRATGEVPGALYVFGGRIFWFYANRVATVRTPIGRKMRPLILHHGAPLIRTKMADATRLGVERRPRVIGVKDGLVAFEDGSTASPETIVWCTGFKRDYSWAALEIAMHDGYPVHTDGVVVGEPGLYFVGLPFQTKLASALVGGVGEDAASVAQVIARRLAIRPAPVAATRIS